MAINRIKNLKAGETDYTEEWLECSEWEYGEWVSVESGIRNIAMRNPMLDNFMCEAAPGIPGRLFKDQALPEDSVLYACRICFRAKMQTGPKDWTVAAFNQFVVSDSPVHLVQNSATIIAAFWKKLTSPTIIVPTGTALPSSGGNGSVGAK